MGWAARSSTIVAAQPMERVMPQHNDLIRVVTALDQNSTVVAVVEMSQSPALEEARAGQARTAAAASTLAGGDDQGGTNRQPGCCRLRELPPSHFCGTDREHGRGRASSRLQQRHGRQAGAVRQNRPPRTTCTSPIAKTMPYWSRSGVSASTNAFALASVAMVTNMTLLAAPVS